MAQDVENTDKKGKAIINRYGILVIILSVFFVMIVYNIIQIMFVERNKWQAYGEQFRVLEEERLIIPGRGNIYADDGRPLAVSKPMYTIRIDFMSEGIKEDTLKKYAGDLSVALAKTFTEKSAAQYKKIILDGWALSRREIEHNKKVKDRKNKRTKSRSVRLINRDINYLELQDLKKFPFFSKGASRSGLTAEENIHREYPFGSIARGTIGSLRNQKEEKDPKNRKYIWAGGSTGIEMKYDSILRGELGRKSIHRIGRKWVDVIELEAVDGLDLNTTIDIDIQDITEKALYAKLAETDAVSGCAIIMDVETGEIKGISNLERMSSGVYAERKPNAFSYMFEPGSTFKTISIMAALEDGVVTPTDSFNVGKGVWIEPVRIGKEIYDHNYSSSKPDVNYLTIAKGMYTSSNVLVAKTIHKGYESNPSRYVDHLYKFGLDKSLTWDIPLKGREGTIYIKHPEKDSRKWYKTTLSRMSYGYETQMPPIYMLMFYNGIANGGKMIKPFVVKSFMKDGKVVEEFKSEVINESLCSEKTLKEMQDILRGVVTDGTAKVVNSKAFEIAGKTGTARLASGGGYNRSEYYVSFCGYFPADKPKYTCIVGVERPKGIPSGGGMAGMVFKNIAEEVYSRNVVLSANEYRRDSTQSKIPYVKGGAYRKAKIVLEELGLSFDDVTESADWVKESADKEKVRLRGYSISDGLVPDVAGMGARDALYILESAGLKVNLKGAGRVVNQSIAAGSRLVKGSRIEIKLE